MNEREVAFDILQRVELESAFAAPLLERATTDPRQLNFLRTLVLGVLRWRSRLDYVAAQFAARSAEKIDQPALQILRLGLFQIMFTDVPRHAAVNETVAAAGTRVPRARGFVNAVLRRATRTDSLLRLVPAGVGIAETLAIRESHPLWIVQRWIDAYGVERARGDFESESGTFSAGSAGEQPQDIQERGGAAAGSTGSFSCALAFSGRRDPVEGTIGRPGKRARGRSFLSDGRGSAAIASLVPVQGKTVVDLAAAPGGKSVVLRLHDGHVVSCDVSLTRLQTLRRTSGRMFEVPPSIVVADARLPPFRKKFDVVLLDAPCSATGTIRRNPEIKWRVDDGTDCKRLNPSKVHARRCARCHRRDLHLLDLFSGEGGERRRNRRCARSQQRIRADRSAVDGFACTLSMDRQWSAATDS